MPKFAFIYHAPTSPADVTPPSPEEQQRMMAAWQEWAAKVGEGMVDFGAPLAGGIQVTPDGTSASTRDVVGYTLIEGDSIDAALTLAKEHPHLNMPGGCTIEVHEAQPIPGM